MTMKWGLRASSMEEFYELLWPSEPLAPYNTLAFPLAMRGELIAFDDEHKEALKCDLEFPLISLYDFGHDVDNSVYFSWFIDSIKSLKSTVKEVNASKIVINGLSSANNHLIVGEAYTEYDSAEELFDDLKQI